MIVVDDTTASGPAVDAPIEVGKNSAAAYIRLTRPAQLNAINDAMRERIATALDSWVRDPDVYGLCISAPNAKVFSAGGDLRELVALVKNDPAAIRRSFAFEYRLNWALDCFAKPTVSLIDGLVVGSGAGLTQFGTHRVAGANYAFAMPETAIGLFPDVGVISVLARLPGGIGEYLALTGRKVGRADAYRLGLATHCIDREEFGAIENGLADADPVDALLEARHTNPGPGELPKFSGVIAEAFTAPTVIEIIKRLALAEAKGGDLGTWAGDVRRDLLSRSPISLTVTLEHLRRVGSEPLDETLIRDYRIACRLTVGHDFGEGVRAMVIDKDRNPKWQPARLEDVSASMIEAHLAPLPQGEDLTLRSRDEMQNLRS